MKRKLSSFEKFVAIGSIIIALIGISYFIAEKEAYNEKQKLINSNLQIELETVVWDDGELMKFLPVPKSNIGRIDRNDEKGFSAYVGETSIEEFEKYVNACSKLGFTVDAKKEDKYFSAKNKDSYKLELDYKGNNIFYISINEPEFDVKFEVECVENLMFSQYDVEIYVDDSFNGTLEHGDTDTYSISLPKGTHTIKFVSEDDEKDTGKVKIDIQKDEKLKFKISCSSSGIKVKTIKGTTTKKETATGNADSSKKKKKTEKTKIKVTMEENDFKGLTTAKAKSKLKDMGFTKFNHEKLSTDKEDLDDKISSVEIRSWEFGKGNFAKGDTYNSDAIVTLWSYKYTRPEKPSPVFYSTNDYETAKKGNTGVFSYKNDGASYDIYWIIDFDEGYVYYFTDGNGENFCDRLKIQSGDLNDKIIVTYHDGGDTWSYKLHFKYVNHPETLIMVDQNGYDWKYSTTDLDEALAIKAGKKIINY